MVFPQGTKRRKSNLGNSEDDTEDTASVASSPPQPVAVDEITPKRICLEDAVFRTGSYTPSLTSHVPAWKKFGLVLRPSLYEAVLANKTAASVTPEVSLASLDRSSPANAARAYSAAPSSAADSFSETDAITGTEGEDQKTNEKEAICTMIEENLTPAVSQSRRRSAKVSVVIPVRCSSPEQKGSPRENHQVQTRKEAVNRTLSTSVSDQEAPLMFQPRRRSTRMIRAVSGTDVAEVTLQDTPILKSLVPEILPVRRPHRRSQRRSYMESALGDAREPEEKESSANEDFVDAGEDDLALRKQSSSRPHLRSSQRVSYALPDESEPEHDPEQESYLDEVSIFEGSEGGIGTESDDDDFPDDEAIPSDESEVNSDDGYTHNQAIPSDESDVDVSDVVVSTGAKPRRKATSAKMSANDAKTHIDLNLPPISNIGDLFTALVEQALELGLEDAVVDLQKRQFPLRVATIFSGTEAPLIALQQISNALEERGLPSIQIDHLFSTEIVPIKQGYIERNFHPKILFRDAREFIAEKTTATTAYGAEVEIPVFINILIAGFVCKDLSNLNNNKKTLKDGGESGDTWKALYSFVKKNRPGVVLIENVKDNRRTWDEVKQYWKDIGYESAWHYCDTKNYGLPQTRQRMYMVAINKELYGKGAKQAAENWQNTMKALARRCSSPFEAWLPKDLSIQHDYANLISETDWVLCKLRYERMRLVDRLGTKHPISQYSENGSVCPPDFANRRFYFSQSSRVYDCFDVAHLLGAQVDGHDSLHKMALWDVSQNADRFKAKLGLLPAITPNGCDFVSNQQTALTGPQLLILQGMPFDKLLLANETPKELQDLAGNAMSTPVIGASLLAALINCHDAFCKKVHEVPKPHSNLAPRVKLNTPKGMKHQTLKSSNLTNLDMETLVQDARSSTQLCTCEGMKGISKSPVWVCKDCGHSACKECCGNPLHVYDKSILKEIRAPPTDFIQKWRPHFPARLSFDKFPDFLKLRNKIGRNGSGNEDWQKFASCVARASLNSQNFSIGEFVRLDNLWKVLYASAKATLELYISKTVEWRLYIHSPKSLPGNSPLRKFLEQPVARGFVDGSLLEPRWELFLPEATTLPLLISAGSNEKTSSWRNRLGLPDFNTETVPTNLNIQSSEGQSVAHDLIGQYTLLPECGTAMSSLYKKASDPPIYLFLDCDLIGHGDLDSFVFSHDLRRMPYGTSRISLARLDCSWRPWAMEGKNRSRSNATIPGSWVVSDFHLKADIPDVHVSLPPAGSVVSELSRGGCSQMVTILDVQLETMLDIHEFAAYSWALEKAKLLPKFTEWHGLHTAAPMTKNCMCAPPYPRILWSVNDRFEATAHEDRKPAAQFERAIQTRPKVFDINASVDSAGTKINVTVNVSVLQHCARSRILERFNTCTEAWRLVTDHVEPASVPFPKILLQSNSDDVPHVGPQRMKLQLTTRQKKSLTWMERQELGVLLNVEEIEEGIHPGLGWRLEVRASTAVTLHGGVLADLPSFGKTVTTIALIQNEFEQKDPTAILEENLKLTSTLPSLIDIAATLIVCPHHIAEQWREEFEKFLDKDQYKEYNVLIVMKHGDLERLTIKDVQNARLVIVSWKALAQGSYVSDLAQFSALPEPVTTKGRAFDAWLDYAIDAIPARLDELRNTGVAEFKKNTSKSLRARLANPDFQAVVPIKIGHGSAYQTYDPSNPDSFGKKVATPIARPKSIPKSRAQIAASVSDSGWTAYPTPLLQLFRFNRVVVDEYHYLYTSLDHYPTYAAVKKINAHKRWILSGTPALTNFSDVNQIATLLGIKIGRDVWDSSNSTTLETRLAYDQTAVEKFVSRTQIMSYQWHEARHHRAQAFADKCVRQNAPSLEHIDCTEFLRPIELGIAHKIVYLELSQHLSSLRMQIKKQKPGKMSKSKSQTPSHRDTRFAQSLRKSETAEEALVNAALEFTTDSGDSGLAALMQTRREHIEETKLELFNLLRRANAIETQSSIMEGSYSEFKELLRLKRGLGDGDSALAVLKLLRKAEGGKIVPSNKQTKTEAVKQLKVLTADIYTTAQELTTRMRSYRFIESIQSYLATISGDQSTSDELGCSSPSCARTTSSVVLVDNCGHMVCKACLGARLNKDSCVHEGCHVPVQGSNLIDLSGLGLSVNQMTEKSFGKKLDDVCELINDMPDEDQCIVFVPNELMAEALEEVFVYHDISHHHNSALLAETIHDFQNNKNPKKMKKVLILTLGGVEASGVNLTNANHIIFLSPHLTESQYEYESQMAQAIARSRRFGQEKKVFIYHFAALRTIDVDILEKRHKRIDGIQELGSPMQMPQDVLSKRSKTKLVRNASWHMALIPATWLEDDAKRATMDMDEDSSFASLISFSDRCQYNDE